MIEALISGKLCGVAEQRTSRSGKPYTTARVRAAVGEGDAIFVSVLAFSASAQAALLALGDGEAVALAGQLTPKAWTDRDGVVRPGLDLVAQQVLTAYHAKRRRDAVQTSGDGTDTVTGIAGTHVYARNPEGSNR